jgi:hypothetical protein
VNEEVGEIVGAFKNGVAKFAKKPKSKSAWTIQTIQSQIKIIYSGILYCSL